MKKEEKQNKPIEEIASEKLSDEELGNVSGGKRMIITYDENESLQKPFCKE